MMADDELMRFIVGFQEKGCFAGVSRLPDGSTTNPTQATKKRLIGAAFFNIPRFRRFLLSITDNR